MKSLLNTILFSREDETEKLRAAIKRVNTAIDSFIRHPNFYAVPLHIVGPVSIDFSQNYPLCMIIAAPSDYNVSNISQDRYHFFVISRKHLFGKHDPFQQESVANLLLLDTGVKTTVQDESLQPFPFFQTPFLISKSGLATPFPLPEGALFKLESQQGGERVVIEDCGLSPATYVFSNTPNFGHP